MRFDNAFFELSCGTLEQLAPSDIPEVAFSGRSNVGKSSMLNKLLSRKALARTSSVPGKTVTLNFYRVDNVRFVDLPGYGFAKAPQKEKERWGRMTEGYFTSGRDIRLVVQLIDMRHPPTADDMQMLNYLKDSGLKFAVALTKSDKLKKMQRLEREKLLEEELAFLGNVPVIAYSTENGEGAEELRKLIEDYCG